VVGLNGDGKAVLQLLGCFSLSTPDHRVALRPSGERLTALLALEGPLQRVGVADRLWPDQPPDRARGNLRNVIWRSRQDHPSLILEEGSLVSLGDVVIDVEDVRDWGLRAVRGEDPGPPPPHAPLELLPGWPEEWLIFPREELRLLQLHALEALAERRLLGGRLGEAASLAQAALGIDQLRESAHRLLIEVHLRAGNRPAALHQFQCYESVLRDAGAAPAVSLTALITQAMLPGV